MMRYAKALVALAAAGVSALSAAISDGQVSGQEWVGVAVAVLAAVGVYAVPNRADGSGG